MYRLFQPDYRLLVQRRSGAHSSFQSVGQCAVHKENRFKHGRAEEEEVSEMEHIPAGSSV